MDILQAMGGGQGVALITDEAVISEEMGLPGLSRLSLLSLGDTTVPSLSLALSFFPAFIQGLG